MKRTLRLINKSVRKGLQERGEGMDLGGIIAKLSLIIVHHGERYNEQICEKCSIGYCRSTSSLNMCCIRFSQQLCLCISIQERQLNPRPLLCGLPTAEHCSKLHWQYKQACICDYIETTKVCTVVFWPKVRLKPGGSACIDQKDHPVAFKAIILLRHNAERFSMV